MLPGHLRCGAFRRGHRAPHHRVFSDFQLQMCAIEISVGWLIAHRWWCSSCQRFERAHQSRFGDTVWIGWWSAAIWRNTGFSCLDCSFTRPSTQRLNVHSGAQTKNGVWCCRNPSSWRRANDCAENKGGGGTNLTTQHQARPVYRAPPCKIRLLTCLEGDMVDLTAENATSYELQTYKDSMVTVADPLVWWRLNQNKFPKLVHLTKVLPCHTSDRISK